MIRRTCMSLETIERNKMSNQFRKDERSREPIEKR